MTSEWAGPDDDSGVTSEWAGPDDDSGVTSVWAGPDDDSGVTSVWAGPDDDSGVTSVWGFATNVDYLFYLCQVLFQILSAKWLKTKTHICSRKD